MATHGGKPQPAPQPHRTPDKLDGVLRDDVHPVEAPKPAAPGDAGNIDRVRDILFGGQMRDFDRRVTRMEERLLKEQADARDDTRRRFEALEGFLKGELEALGSRLKSEQEQRAAGEKEAARVLADAEKALDRKVQQLDEQAMQKSRELRQQMLDQSTALREEVRQAREQLGGALLRQGEELRGDKVDRAALAGFLSEVAMRLTGELKIPE